MLYGSPAPPPPPSPGQAPTQPGPPPPTPTAQPGRDGYPSPGLQTPQQLPPTSQPAQPPIPTPAPAAKDFGIEPLFKESAPPIPAPTELESERARWLKFAQAEYRNIVDAIDDERAQKYAEIAQLEQQIEEIQATSDLQDLGLIFSGEHPVAKSADYKNAVADARNRRKTMAKTPSGAVLGNQSWAIGGDIAEGRKLIDESSKLMLRAYNNELDALIKATNATNAEQKVSLLTKKRDQIKRLGKRMGLEVSPQYHDLAVWELRQVGRFEAAKLVEKERDRAHKEKLREEKRVADEIAKEQAKLDQELRKHEDALAKLRVRHDASPTEIAELEAKLEEVQDAQSDVTRRAANTRAGHVYVISNPGSFGPSMIKIGMTRRLNPQERVDELGDASVPFRFSVHAMIFSDDAVGLEGDLHAHFADRRVNKINVRREFFYATPAEVRDALVGLNAHMLEFDEGPINDEWAASQ